MPQLLEPKPPTEAPSVSYRSAAMVRAELSPETRTVPMSISSETPVLRWLCVNDQWVIGYEVLDHSSLNAIDLSRFTGPFGGPLLFNHGETEADSPLIGRFTIEGLKDKALRGVARFAASEFADECFTDVKDDVLVDVSIGYDYDFKDLEPIGLAPDGYPIYRVTRWALIETSMVPMPADINVGKGRAAQPELPLNQPAVPAAIRMEAPMALEPGKTAAPEVPAADIRTTPVNIQELQSTAVKEALEVRSIAAKLRLEKDFDELTGSGITMTEVRLKLLERAASAPLPGMPPVSEQIGLTEKEKARFSVAKAVLSLVTGDRSMAAFEREVSVELGKRMGRSTAGILVPTDIPVSKDAKRMVAQQLATRAALSVNAGAGLNPQAENVFSEYAGFIDLLRPASVLMSLGVQMQSGLRDNYAFVRQTAGATAYVLAEGVAPADSDTQYELVEMKPHAMKAVLRYTKQQLAQSVFNLEAELSRDLVLAHATKQDAEGIAGTALSSSLLTAAGVNLVPFGTGAATWADFIAMKTAVMKSNADRLGAMAYLTDPDVLGYAEATPRFTNTGIPIYDNGKIGMFAAEWSNQVPLNVADHQAIAGVFSQALFGEWGALELLVNPYSEDTEGIIRITTHDFIDFQVKQPKAFAKSTDIKLA